jgi:hypothetical protein
MANIVKNLQSRGEWVSSPPPRVSLHLARILMRGISRRCRRHSQHTANLNRAGSHGTSPVLRTQSAKSDWIGRRPDYHNNSTLENALSREANP